jgi:hypothetical protein
MSHGLWHLEFHQGSRKVFTAAGAWLTPHLLGVLSPTSAERHRAFPFEVSRT